MNRAPLIGISRLRMGTDGHGITTLVAFHGCPLRCRYCLNPHCLSSEGVKRELSPNEVYDIVKKDALYFLSTNGGVCFGGGEPLLRPKFIKEVLELGAKRWHTTIETSLNVPRENLKILLPYINQYIVDIKDMDPVIYEMYTGKENNQVIENLRYLAEQGLANKVTCRIPLIFKYNNEACQYNSITVLKKMGYTKFDKFSYKVTDSALKEMDNFERPRYNTGSIME